MFIHLLSKVKTFKASFRRKRFFKQNQIYIAKGSYIDENCTIGKRTRINHISHLGACTIGNYCAVGGRLVVRSSNHFINFANMQNDFQKNFLFSKTKVAGKHERDTVIGHACWLGDSVIVLPDVHIGDGAIIGAGSIVTKDIPPFSIAVGNPAKVIKSRFSNEVIEFLLETAWWYWDDDKLLKNKWFFEVDFAAITPAALSSLKREII